jgi:hypothetical protein
MLSDEEPAAFRWNRRCHAIQGVSARWRIHALWWTDGEVWRDYWEVTTDTGLLCVLFHDGRSEAWFLERVYE